MYGVPSTTHRHPVAAEDLPLMRDWREDHRPLTLDQRRRVGSYINAIVARRGGTDPEHADAFAKALWVSFRETFDGLRGMFAKSPEEDFRRAMRRL